MIDYDKLKLAEELCAKTDGWYFSCYLTSKGKVTSVSLLHSIEYDIGFNNLDQLIAKLQELAKPKPKYEIGQTVYVREDNNIISFEIDEIIYDSEYFYLSYTCDGEYLSDDGSFDQYIEDALYPTVEALIQSQIHHWQQLKQDHCDHNYNAVRIESFGKPGAQCCSKCGKDKPGLVSGIPDVRLCTNNEGKSTDSEDMSITSPLECEHECHFDTKECQCVKSPLEVQRVSLTVCIKCKESVCFLFTTCGTCGKVYL